MPNYSCESENGTIVAAYPNKDHFTPHIGLSLAHVDGPEGRPCVIVARLSPDDARAVGVALQQAADHIQISWDEFKTEVESDGVLGD
jgi:hypothetical protein